MKPTQFAELLITTILVIGMSMMTFTTAIAAEVYDLVIFNGQIMDPESGLDAVQ
jgi:hypothetical protein